MSHVFTKKVYLKSLLYDEKDPDLTYYQNLSATWSTFKLAFSLTSGRFCIVHDDVVIFYFYSLEDFHIFHGFFDIFHFILYNLLFS